MRGQAIGADLGASLEPGHDHEPADRALEPAEDEQRRQPPAVGFWDRPADREPADTDEKDQSEDASQQPVHPLPEEDEPEAGERHSSGAGDLAILWRLPV